MYTDFRKRRKGEGETERGEKKISVREKHGISCLLYVPLPGIERTI